MAVTIKTSELCKRITFRYYPILTVFALPITYIPIFLSYHEIKLSPLLPIMCISPIYFWLLIIMSLKIIKPVGFINRLSVMIITYLTGILIQHSILYFDFNYSIFSGSLLSIRIVLASLTAGIFIIGSVILAERSLIFEKTYIEEKTERRSSEKQLMENQLDLLQARIEPRFLFNTMKSISGLFDTAPEKAKVMQMYFIKYLRSTLVKTREPVTTIKQEIELITSYLDIIKISMYDHLEYQIEIDPQTKDLPFPSMLIQPIVEGAINNSLDKNLPECKISLSVEKLENMIRVKVTNTGKEYEEKEGIESIIEEIKERITRLFGDKGGLRLEENIPSGLTVILEVPCG